MKRLPRHTLVLASLVFLLASSTGRSQDNNDLAKRALALLEERCFSCHGEEGVAEGGLNFILNPPRLVAREIVVPGDALNSKLYRMVKSGDMPRDDDPLTPQEIELLRTWIDSDGPGFKPLPLNRKFISPENTLELIQEDLKEIDPNDQRFHRYFTITHLYNAGIPDSELETYRRALSKLINSLSWGGTIVRPVPIDPARTVLRIDINDFLWTEETWDRILEENPYGVTYDKPGTQSYTAAAAYCYKATGTDQPFIRADWFVARASVPPLYHDILEMPTTDRELEERLRVNVDRNLQIGRAARAGFNGSGVSENNRLIERHVADLTRGAYWKSYDFSANSGVQNLFARPLGPNGKNAFEHAGGEIIFNLPNGLQAYLLVDAKGNRIDKGPTEIVRDNKRPDGAVVNGLSCMSCHTRGMIFKDDQVRQAVQGNAAFSAAVRNKVERLYPPKRDFRRLQEADAKRFADAVTETGGTVGTTEPILTLALRFEEELDLPLAAAEAGLPAADFLAGLKTSPQLARTLSPLVVPGGTVKRDVYVANFADIISELRIGRHVAGTSSQPFLTNSIGMKLTLIPAGEFQMGSPDAEQDREDNETRHLVKISKPFYLGVYEVTQQQYEKVMEARPWEGEERVKEGPDYAASYVSHDEAVEFCRRLSKLEGVEYRLPTEAEWEYACRAGTTTAYSFGDGEAKLGQYAWYSKNALDIGEDYPHRVGQKLPNPRGLYDMHGNVYEWCQDWFGPYGREKAVNDPMGPAQGTHLLARGGAFNYSPSDVRSAGRKGYRSGNLFDGGFRVVRTPAAKKPDVATVKKQMTPAQLALGDPVANSIGMLLVPIPAGEFQMGSPGVEPDREGDETRHLVKISKPFYLAVHEITQQQYEKVMGARPWQGEEHVKEGADYPAVYVSHDEAVEFCRRLSKQEGVEYRLPTEAEWEYACRGGTTTVFTFGDGEAKLGQYAWSNKNTRDIGEEYAHGVGQKLPNPWGLYDIHGNVWEWCQDWYAPYGSEKVVSDPVGPAQGERRVLRGGSFNRPPSLARSASRTVLPPGLRDVGVGFRAARTYSAAP